MNTAQDITKIHSTIAKEHDEYRGILSGSLEGQESEKYLSLTDKIDRVAFHVIEEIIELRRTYPHKYWKKTKEEINRDEMLEETADVFLMTRAMIMAVCKANNISELDFLNIVLEKIRKNKERIKNGY